MISTRLSPGPLPASKIAIPFAQILSLVRGDVMTQYAAIAASTLEHPKSNTVSQLLARKCKVSLWR